MDVDKIVSDRLAADSEFQTRVAGLPETDKVSETEKRRKEILGEEFQKREDNYQHTKTRAEKAEAERDALKPAPKGVPDAKEESLSHQDNYVLMTNQVHPDDVAEVVKASKILGKTITETLADPTFAPVLASRVDKRRTANSTSTGAARAGATTRSDEQVLEDAQKGILPEKGSEAAQQLFMARRNKQRGGAPKK